MTLTMLYFPGTLSQRSAAPSERLRLRQEQAEPVLAILKADLSSCASKLQSPLVERLQLCGGRLFGAFWLNGRFARVFASAPISEL